MPDEKIPITVTHPRTSVPYLANVAPECPAEVVLKGLQDPSATDDGPFLAPAPTNRPYVLVLTRTNQALAPRQTMAAAGVRAHDALSVEQMGQGATK